MRFWPILFISAVMAGCTSTPTLDDSTTFQSSNYFSKTEALHKSRLAKFTEGNLKEYSEEEKITYLLQSIKISELTYVRNGDHFDGKKAARWLRWKMTLPRFRKNPIDTADEFVNVVSVGSMKTGIPYQVKLENGRYVKMQDILQNELKSLEEAILEKVQANQKGLIAEPTAAIIPQTASVGEVGLNQLA